MTYHLSELIDLDALQTLMDSLYRATGIVHALLDNEGQVLTSVGWQPICTDFHRANPRTCQRCRKSDRHLLSRLDDGPYVGHDCVNGLADYATSVVIEGEHVGAIFTGQMFHAAPDLEFFLRQAREFGFDTPRYMEAVRQVPIVPMERMPDIMAFLVGLAQMLGQQGLMRLRHVAAKDEFRQLNDNLARRVLERTAELSEKNRQLERKIIELEQAGAALSQEKQFSDDIINSLSGAFYMLDQSARLVRWNHKLCEVTGYSRDQVAAAPALDFFDDDTKPLVQEGILEAFERGESAIQVPLLTRAARRIPYYFSGRKTRIGERAYVVGFGIDISARKRAEDRLQQSLVQLRRFSDHQHTIKERERKRIAQDIHDELGQNLLVLKMDVVALYTRTKDSHPGLNKRAGVALNNVQETIKSVKLIMNDLRPAMLDLGLYSAVQWQIGQFERMSGVACMLTAEPEGEFGLGEVQTVAVFRILQEALTNVARHAMATEVEISLHQDQRGFSMEVKDNGVGLQSGDTQKTNSFGLIGMKERIHALGGEFSISKNPGRGTILSVFIAASMTTSRAPGATSAHVLSTTGGARPG
ncbi:MAG: PocR ligand-binding domain-containing protein [Burkholderiaceae bacterium]|nr:PocR ligand-binding domain-containing protein [Burkholderiaceae bacterium]